MSPDASQTSVQSGQAKLCATCAQMISTMEAVSRPWNPFTVQPVYKDHHEKNLSLLTGGLNSEGQFQRFII